jgi:hypothetical protein
MKKLCFALVTVALAGCSSILDSRTQTITIMSDPAGANCRLLRSGTVIAEISGTPGTATVRKSTHDIVIVCDKAGYQQASTINVADVSAETVGSAILGGGLGWAIDSTTGTANQYDSKVTVKLVPMAK